MAKVLKKDTALKTLDLGFNRLEDDGALHLADALATCNMTLNTYVFEILADSLVFEVKSRCLCILNENIDLHGPTTISIK